MPTNSITNANPMSSINPIEPPNQSVEPLTEQQFKAKINEYISEGIKNNLSQDYVAQQIETLAKENPDLASQSGLTDYQIIKKGVEKAYQAGAHNRPLALDAMPEATKTTPSKSMTEEEKQVIKNVGHDVIIGATIATGVAIAPIALSVAKSAWQAVVGAAATPQGQQIINNTIDCLESIQDYSPPTGTVSGFYCGATQKIDEIIEYYNERK